MAEETEDVSEIQESYPGFSEISLEQYLRELGALQEATAALLSTLDLEKLLGKILDSATAAIMTSEKGAIYLLAPETGELEIRAVLGYGETDPRIHQLVRSQSLPYIDEVIKRRVPIIATNLQAAPLTRSFILAPLILEGKVLGVISLEANPDASFSQGDLRLLASFAITATAAIRNAQLHAEVQRLAITDHMTGLYNRRGLSELGDREVERAWRFQRDLAVIMLDIDDLKSINDTYGHAVGDSAIKHVAYSCQSNTRKIDVLCRYGGDEFVILLPENNLSAAKRIAERLQFAIANSPFRHNGQDIPVSLSMGLSMISADNRDLKALLQSADEALYLAKSRGKNQIITK